MTEAAATGAFLVGSGALGAWHEGEAGASAAEFNASMADRNAALTKQQSAEEERRARVLGRKQLGSIRSTVGASGISMEGSALDVLEESAANAELDALTIRHSGQMRSQNYEAEGRLERAKARNSRTAGYLGAATASIMGASKLSTMGAG
jgi:hypothetical protein